MIVFRGSQGAANAGLRIRLKHLDINNQVD